MTREQTVRFFDEVIRGIWSNWKPSGLDTSLWLALLRQCKYDESESALRRWYANSDRTTRKPIPGQMRNILIWENQQDGLPKGPRKEFGLARKESPDKITWFFISSGRKREHNEILGDAEKKRTSTEELYGGDRIIIWPSEDKLDDGLRGPVALARAVDTILSGADMPGRRFLERILA